MVASGGEGVLRQRAYGSMAAEEGDQWGRLLRSLLWQRLHLDDWVTSEPVPLDIEEEDVQVEDGVERRVLSFASTAARRVTAVLAMPVATQQAVPAVVSIHGHGGNRLSVYDPDSIYKGFAAELPRRGIATIAVDVGQHEVFEAGRSLMGERLWDLRRCVDLLVGYPRVDSTRIGCAGLSLGGEMAMWLGAMDERVAVQVSAGFLTTMDQMEKNHCMCWKFEGLRELVDYADLYAMMAPRPLMCQNGLEEGETQFWVPLARQALEEIEPAYQDAGTADRLCLHVHLGGHEVDLPALVDFFRRWL